MKDIGFEEIRVKGSHHFLRHPDRRATVVPAHSKETLGPGLLASILRDVKVTRARLQELL
ncbi:type II toxin-antitoxin system HicA family toxin [Cyanobium sp. Lug-B]|nr:type II toxin-antitoxin system HicA family toxin [Cyanobium sp. Lug-B]